MLPQYVNKWFSNNIIYRGIGVVAILMHHITSSTPMHYVLCADILVGCHPCFFTFIHMIPIGYKITKFSLYWLIET